jgi:hypothetical protein
LGDKSEPQEISIHFSAFDDTENLTLDNFKHFFPNFSINLSETCSAVHGRFGDVWYVGRRGREPNFEEFFWPFERGTMVVGHGHCVNVAMLSSDRQKDKVWATEGSFWMHVMGKQRVEGSGEWIAWKVYTCNGRSSFRRAPIKI